MNDTPTYAINRRRALQGLALAGTGALAACEIPRERFQAQGGEPAPKPAGLKDPDIFNFALNLEYLESEYYLRGTTGQGLTAADAGANPGPVTGGRQVQFEDSVLRQFAEELAANELAHVRYIRNTLGNNAISRPAIDFRNAFSVAADAAGLGADFDPFANQMTFYLGSMLFEDVGVTAYTGAAAQVSDKKLLSAAAAVLATEAYHMGMCRTQLVMMGERAWRAANAISAVRDRLDGPKEKDQGIIRNSRINIAPLDASGIAFARMPQEVLRIFYLTPQQNVARGGFFPNGVNGEIKLT